MKHGFVTIFKGNVKLKGVRIDDMYLVDNNNINKTSICYYSDVLNDSY